MPQTLRGLAFRASELERQKEDATATPLETTQPAKQTEQGHGTEGTKGASTQSSETAASAEEGTQEGHAVGKLSPKGKTFKRTPQQVKARKA